VVIIIDLVAIILSTVFHIYHTTGPALAVTMVSTTCATVPAGTGTGN
jgi:hypothetical protein